jgi:hypothetical protein
MQRILIDQFIASFKMVPEELVLDFDATDDLVHGNQDGRHFSAYYDNYCFLPLYVFCGEQLLVAYLRPAKYDAALHAAVILKLLVTRLRQPEAPAAIAVLSTTRMSLPLPLPRALSSHAR